MRLILLSVALVFCIPWLCAGDVSVCVDCGWETPDDVGPCAHCGRITPVKVAGSDGENRERPADAGGGEAALDPSLLDTELRLALKLTRAGDRDLARLFWSNALYLRPFCSDGDGRGRKAIMDSLAKEMGPGSARVGAKCPGCEGTGSRVVNLQSLASGREERREITGGVCGVCYGSGYVRRFRSESERKEIWDKSLLRFKSLQAERNYVAVGQAWIPAGVEASISFRRKAGLAALSLSVCGGCSGTGAAECGKCRGYGLVECEECERGDIFVKVRAELSKTTLSRSEKCKSCRGTGMRSCGDCRGGGFASCRKCEGTGSAPVCEKCGKKGYIDCKKCDGSGNFASSVCDQCLGEGAVTCSVCIGSNRK